jgi:hypothetical protein
VRNVVYETQRNFFGWPEKEPNEVIAEAFRQRLKKVDGFDQVPDPRPMKNSKGAIVYDLYFASQDETAAKIARQIFAKYREQGSQKCRQNLQLNGQMQLGTLFAAAPKLVTGVSTAMQRLLRNGFAG